MALTCHKIERITGSRC